MPLANAAEASCGDGGYRGVAGNADVTECEPVDARRED